MMDKGLLIRCAGDVGVSVSPELAERFSVYARLLVEWNEKMNLTAITDPAGIAVKHFADSLAASPLLPEGTFSLIDVGTGAGFPGVPLALLRNDCRLTLLDSLNKRLVFLETLCRELGLPVTLVHARAEEGGRSPDWRERFDVATARAVAALPVLCEYCLPFVRPGGRFIALKGRDGDREKSAAEKAISVLGGKPGRTVAFRMPVEPVGDMAPADRMLISVDKIANTPSKYPRPPAKIAKQPL